MIIQVFINMWSQQVILKSIQEDQLLQQIVQTSEQKRWINIAKKLSSLNGTFQRTSRQCRDRWMNYLDPRIKTDKWTEEEENLLFQYQARYGNKWSIIAKKLEGRPQNFVKNHFYSAFRKGLRKVNRFIESQLQRSQCRSISDHFLTRVLVLAHDSKAFRASHAEIHEKCIIIKQELIRYSKAISVQGEQKERMRHLIELILQVNRVYRNRKRPRKDKKAETSSLKNIQKISKTTYDQVQVINTVGTKEASPPEPGFDEQAVAGKVQGFTEAQILFYANQSMTSDNGFQQILLNYCQPIEPQPAELFYWSCFQPWQYSNFLP